MAATFGFRTTAEEVVGDRDLSGMTAVVTGGNSGIGTETARVLANAGADVVITSRSLEAGEVVAKEINAASKGRVTVKQLDLADLSSVDAFVRDLSHSVKTINLLLLNAGVMAVPTRQLTKDGFELQTGTNHLGHFHLVSQLLPKLRKQRVTARVVVVASYAHVFNGKELPLDDLNWERRKYGAWRAYGQSKLLNILFASELARRAEEGRWPIKAYSLHPGSIATNLTRHTVGHSVFGWLAHFIPGIKTIPQGAATTCYAALAPELDSQSGAYLTNCCVTQPTKLAQDAELAKQVWAKSDEMVAAALKRAKNSPGKSPSKGTGERFIDN